jgi:hypothetical protein
VRESWFDGETFVDLDDARRSAEVWCREIAGARVHGTTRRVPRELFESVEKVAMRAPPDSPFDVPTWIDKAKVHPDHHIQVAHALYSVPNLFDKVGSALGRRDRRESFALYAIGLFSDADRKSVEPIAAMAGGDGQPGRAASGSRTAELA